MQLVWLGFWSRGYSGTVVLLAKCSHPHANMLRMTMLMLMIMTILISCVSMLTFADYYLTQMTAEVPAKQVQVPQYFNIKVLNMMMALDEKSADQSHMNTYRISWRSILKLARHYRFSQHVLLGYI